MKLKKEKVTLMSSRNNKRNNQNRKNTQKKNNSNLSIILSIISLVVSLIAAYTSFNQYKLATKQDNESKTAIWTGEYDEIEQDFSIVTGDSQIKLQHATVLFPSDLNLNSQFITTPDFKFSTIMLELAISDYLDSKYKRSKDSHTIIQADIPIVINSNYTAKGNLHQLSSSYSINYIATLSADEEVPPSVEIKGMWFSQHVPDKHKDSQFYLDIYWEGLYKMYQP